MLHVGMSEYFGSAGNHRIPLRSTSISNLDLDDNKSVVSDISDDRGCSEDDSLHYSDDMDCREEEEQDIGNVHNNGLASCPEGNLLGLNPISLHGNSIMVSPCQRGKEDTVIEQLDGNHGSQSLLQRNISSEMTFSNPSSSSVDLLGVNSYAQACITSRIDMNNYKGSMEKLDRAYRESKGFSRQYATPSSIGSISTKSTAVPRFIYVTDDADSSAASNGMQQRHRRTLSATSISLNTLENLDDEGWDSAKRREFFVNQRDINSKSKFSKEVSYYMSKVLPITRRVNSKKLKLVKSNGLLT